MTSEKPTEAIPVKKTIADATKFSQGLSSVELTEAILTALDAAGYAIVPREPTDAMVRAGWDQMVFEAESGRRPDTVKRSYAKMISAAEKGE